MLPRLAKHLAGSSSAQVRRGGFTSGLPGKLAMFNLMHLPFFFIIHLVLRMPLLLFIFISINACYQSFPLWLAAIISYTLITSVLAGDVHDLQQLSQWLWGRQQEPMEETDPADGSPATVAVWCTPHAGDPIL